MIGYTQPEKSHLSTSKEKTSRRTNNSCSYQQLERRNLLTTFVVNTADDIVADDGLVSLREAITAANSAKGSAKIVWLKRIISRMLVSVFMSSSELVMDEPRVGPVPTGRFG